MENLTMKDTLSSVILIHVSFGTPSVDDHDDLIGSLTCIFVDMHHGCENVGGMGGIRHVNSYVVSGSFIQMVFWYFLPKSLSKVLSYLFCCFLC